MGGHLRAAIAHISPIIFSAQQTTNKAILNIELASRHGANLVAFPESYIPAFPFWSTFIQPAQGHDLFHRMVDQAIYADGEEMKAIRQTALKSKTIVSLGFTEKVRYSHGALFNSNIIIGEDGNVLVHHRKLVPTWIEKLTWAAGDGYGLRVANTQHGKIGALICGENTNALARYSLIAQGEQVHISTWPALWASRVHAFENSTPPTTDSKRDAGRARDEEPRNYDNLMANRTRAAAHCFEAKCFGIMAAPHLSLNNIDTVAQLTDDPARTTAILQGTPKAASMFLDPTGTVLPGTHIGLDSNDESSTRKEYLQDEEGLLLADLDLKQCVEGKQYHDVVGGYQRFDVFDLKVNRRRQVPITFDDGPSLVE